MMLRLNALADALWAWGGLKHRFLPCLLKKSTQDLKSKAIVNKQRGFLRGLLIGGLLASLFMGHGLPIALLSWMMIAGLILFMMNLYRKRQMNRL